MRLEVTLLEMLELNYVVLMGYLNLRLGIIFIELKQQEKQQGILVLREILR